MPERDTSVEMTSPASCAMASGLSVNFQQRRCTAQPTRRPGTDNALREPQALGPLDGKSSRIVSVQAYGQAPIVRASEERRQESSFWPDSKTLAFDINAPKAPGDRLVLLPVYDSDGRAIAVDDEESLQEQDLVGRLEGLNSSLETRANLL